MMRSMAKFKSWRNRIRCDEGFTVTVGSGMSSLTYSEGKRSIKVDCEFASDGSDRVAVVYVESMQEWSGPERGSAVLGQERERIVTNIARAFGFDGFRTEAVYPDEVVRRFPASMPK
jgi:hypothetical protein